MDRATAASMFVLIQEAGERLKQQKATAKIRTQLQNKLARLFAKQGIAFTKQLKMYLQTQPNLTQNDIKSLLEITTIDDNAAQFIQRIVTQAVKIGAEELLKQFEFEASVFSLENPRAVTYLENYGADFVTAIDKTTRDRLRVLLARSTSSGWAYSRLATTIHKTFGEFSTKRSKRIAVHEIGSAYQKGNLIVAQELAAQGVQIEKSWLTRKDDKVDEHCTSNEAAGWIDVNDPFPSGAMRPLDHVGCRCVAMYRRKTK